MNKEESIKKIVRKKLM